MRESEFRHRSLAGPDSAPSDVRRGRGLSGVERGQEGLALFRIIKETRPRGASNI